MSIFRKSSLERLSSPEEIDQLMQVTSSRSWLALIAIVLLLGILALWSFRGRVATTIAGQGAIVRHGEVRNVVTSSAGVLSHLDVRVGDHIHVNQVLGSIEQPSVVKRLELSKRELAQAEQTRTDTFQLGTAQSQLQIAALHMKERNAEQQIVRIGEQITLAEDQARVVEGLQQKGLVTRKQVVDARQQVAALQTELANRHAEIDQLQSDRFGWEKKPLGNDVAEREHILELQGNVEALEKDLQLQTLVVSPYEGEVLEVQVSSGERVQAQTPVVSIQPEVNNLEVVAYIPSLRAKEVRPGMEAQVSPSIVKREEYGFMRGRVLSVGAFPATKAALMHNFENETLASALSGSSAITEIHVAILPDSSTATGFRWSSSKGPPILLSSGMLCGVQVVTLRQRPAELFLPFLKGQVGLN